GTKPVKTARGDRASIYHASAFGSPARRPEHLPAISQGDLLDSDGRGPQVGDLIEQGPRTIALVTDTEDVDSDARDRGRAREGYDQPREILPVAAVVLDQPAGWPLHEDHRSREPRHVIFAPEAGEQVDGRLVVLHTRHAKPCNGQLLRWAVAAPILLVEPRPNVTDRAGRLFRHRPVIVDGVIPQVQAHGRL